jgi:hypothetical protein
MIDSLMFLAEHSKKNGDLAQATIDPKKLNHFNTRAR